MKLDRINRMHMIFSWFPEETMKPASAFAIKREKYFKTGFGRRFLQNRLETYLRKI
jgi:hypothetical protein